MNRGAFIDGEAISPKQIKVLIRFCAYPVTKKTCPKIRMDPNTLALNLLLGQSSVFHHKTWLDFWNPHLEKQCKACIKALTNPGFAKTASCSGHLGFLGLGNLTLRRILEQDSIHPRKAERPKSNSGTLPSLQGS